MEVTGVVITDVTFDVSDTKNLSLEEEDKLFLFTKCNYKPIKI